MKLKTFISIAGILFFQFVTAQNIREYKSWNPAADSLEVLEGKLSSVGVKDFYSQLPATLSSDTIEPLKINAGLQLRFNTDADEIIVKFIPEKKTVINTTGIDLYCKTINGNWLFIKGKYSFGDTIIYRFNNLDTKDEHVNNRQYYLYLPLCNTVKWMEITAPKKSFFKPLPVRIEQPIIVYGNSFLKKECASNPGFFWTNILSRKLERPVINFSFSGNEIPNKEWIELLAKTGAKIFVLNLSQPNISTAELKYTIAGAVKLLQIKSPGTPILLTQNDLVNNALKEVYDSLIASGVKNIYLLTKKEIAQHTEMMIESLYLNDTAMMRYATVFEKKIRTILNEPAGNISTTIPVTQRRDAASYDWETRHNQVLALNKTFNPKIVFIGNSITHYWGGQPAAPYSNGAAAWKKYFESKQVINMGFGWDRIENVLWRIHHGELDNIAPKKIAVMIGTNNLQHNTDNEIVEGLQFLIKAIHHKQPAAQILLMGILPRKGMEERIVHLDKIIANKITGTKINHANAGILFLKKDKKINEALFSDGLHPNAAGYEMLGRFIEQLLLKHSKGSK
jgi:lysophospholipase L1-like esterase